MRGKRWPPHTQDAPWFDRPDALEFIENGLHSRRYDEEQAAMLRQWVRTGYVTLAGLIDDRDIDEMLADQDALWAATEPIEWLVIDGLRWEGADPSPLPHSRLVQMSAEERARLRAQHTWRSHAFYHFSKPARRVFENAALREACSLIFGRPAIPSFSINFTFGSDQHLHEDSVVFHIQPANYLIGCWIACEDIHPDSGPLVYYPGSHRAPLFSAFDNYPQTNLRTCDKRTAELYERHVDERAAAFERHRFMARKGEALLWHGMLLHGGDSIRDPERTRRSFVIHYMPEGANKEKEIEGPFNW